jgi:hypothetical protein
VLFPGVACFFLAFCAGAATHILNETHVTKQKYNIDRQGVWTFRCRRHAKPPCDLSKHTCLVSPFQPPSHAYHHACSAHVTCIALPSLGSPRVQLSLIVVMLPCLLSSDQPTKPVPARLAYHHAGLIMSTEPAPFHWAWKIPTGFMPQVNACAFISLSSIVKHNKNTAHCHDFEMKQCIV